MYSDTVSFLTRKVFLNLPELGVYLTEIVDERRYFLRPMVYFDKITYDVDNERTHRWYKDYYENRDLLIESLIYFTHKYQRRTVRYRVTFIVP